jgi:aspartyl protease family protein
VSGRRHFVREGLQWAAVALLVLGGFYFREDILGLLPMDRQPTPTTTIAVVEPSGFDREVRVRADARGHFEVKAFVNGRPATLLADTGATIVVLTYEEAERLGLSPHSLAFSASVQTANGIARVAPVLLDQIKVDTIAVRGVQAAVAERGALGMNLLGMSFLKKLRRFELSGPELLMVQ